MALRSDFEVISFHQHLGDKPGDINAPAYKFVGDQTTVKNFFIGQQPSGPGYLLIQAFDVHESSHQIVINGNNLGGFDIPREVPGWQTWMDIIESGNLRQGNNTIQIRRDTSTGDNFLVGTVVVHWREFV